MFNKKLKQELLEYKEAYFLEKIKADELSSSYSKQCREMERLMKFDKIMLEKIEELCKPKINDFCLSMIGSGMVVSKSSFDSSVTVSNKNYKNLEDLLTQQAENIERLNKSEEDTKKILFLSGKVDELLTKLSKMKISEVKSLKNKK